MAWFWNANATSQLNKTLEDFATQNDMDLLDTVRLLAMGNMVRIWARAAGSGSNSAER